MENQNTLLNCYVCGRPLQQNQCVKFGDGDGNYSGGMCFNCIDMVADAKRIALNPERANK